jgi:CBS domain-containing protein
MNMDFPIKDWMTSNVVSVEPNASIIEADQIMKEFGIRRLPVVTGTKVIGMVTKGDIREASPSDANSLTIWEMNYLINRIQVKDVMTKDVISVSSDDSIYDAAALMLDNKVSGLPVIDRNKHIVGIITESDIFRMVVASQRETT